MALDMARGCDGEDAILLLEGGSELRSGGAIGPLVIYENGQKV